MIGWLVYREGRRYSARRRAVYRKRMRSFSRRKQLTVIWITVVLAVLLVIPVIVIAAENWNA